MPVHVNSESQGSAVLTNLFSHQRLATFTCTVFYLELEGLEANTLTAFKLAVSVIDLSSQRRVPGYSSCDYRVLTSSREWATFVG